jgi:hypothetical protein
MANRPLVRILWLVLVVALVLFLWEGGVQWPAFLGRNSEAAPRTVTARGDLAADERATIELFERAKDSVVYISTRQQVMDFWTRNVFSVPRGTGSGFVWDEAGHVVTNFHVIEGASEARVKLADGRDYKAALVGAPRPRTTSRCSRSGWASSARRPCRSARATTSRWGRRCSRSATPSGSTGRSPPASSRRSTARSPTTGA